MGLSAVADTDLSNNIHVLYSKLRTREPEDPTGNISLVDNIYMFY